MLESLIQTIASGYDVRRHRELFEAIWRQEVWFDTPHQDAAAHVIRDALEQDGLDDVELSAFACDGKTRYQDWMTHPAWDCPAAQLAIVGGEVLADRANKSPLAVVYWSGPLGKPDKPAVGGVVDGDKLEKITAKAVKGKFVLTAKPAVEMKRRLIGAKPLAVVSDYLGKGNGYTENTTKWCNTWSDGPDGWYMHAGDMQLAGFMLSTAAGKLLRAKLATEPDLQLAGFCQSRLYDGSSLSVTATLAGTDPSGEIWIYGHNGEEGAHDNSSGESILAETLRLLKRLIMAGKLPRPRFTIRMVTMEECLGMAAFATLHDDARRRALAGFNLDGAGAPSPEAVPFQVNFGPYSSPSFGWAAAAMLARQVQQLASGEYRTKVRRFIPTADDMIADPKCGIPSLWLGQGSDCLGYHSDADAPGICPDESLRCNTLVTAAWAYLMASLDDRSAGELAGPADAWVKEMIARPGDGDVERLSRWTAAGVLRDLGRWGVSPSVYEGLASQYSPAGAPPLPDLPTDGPRYFRRTWGTTTLETLPAHQREGFSRWSNWQAAASYWNDGRRTLPAVERLTRAECGKVGEGKIKEFFDICLAAGLMTQDNAAAFAKQ